MQDDCQRPCHGDLGRLEADAFPQPVKAQARAKLLEKQNKTMLCIAVFFA